MRRPRQPRDEGASSVEFALVASFLLLPLLFGIIQYGFYFFQATTAEHVAQEGARLAAVGIDSCEEWEESVKRRATGLGDPVVAVGPAREEDENLTRGMNVEVTVTWSPAINFLPFVPGIDDNPPETVVTRVERVGTVKAEC